MSDLPVVADPGSWLLAVVKKPYHVLFFIFLISVFFSYELRNLRVQTSIYELVIEDLPEAARYEDFKREFGTEELVIVVIRSKQSVFSQEVFREIKELSGRLSSLEGVRRVISLSEIIRAMDVTGRWSLSDVRTALAPVDLIKKNIVSEDEKTSAITLLLDEKRARSDLVDAVESVISGKEASSYQIGMPVVSKALADFTMWDFKMLPPISLLVIAVILWFVFREARATFIALSTVLLTLIWTFGMMAFTGIPLSMVTMVVPVFLIAVGTAYCLYTLVEYMNTNRVQGDPATAAYRCISQVGFPTSLAVVTTVIGLASLLINRITAIREFALFSCFGILSLLALVLTYIPAMLALIPPGRLRRPSGKPERRPEIDDKIASVITSAVTGHQTALFFVAAAVFLAGAIGLQRLKIETNPVEFFKRDSSISRRFHDIYKDLAGSFPINVVIEGKEPDFFERPQNLKRLEEIQQGLMQIKGVDKTVSFNDYLKLVNYASNGYRAEAYRLPEEPFEVRMLVNSFKTMLGDDLLMGFVSRDFSKMNIMLRTHLSSSADFLNARKEIAEKMEKLIGSSMSWYATGFGLVISESSNLLALGQAKSLSLTLGLISIIMVVLFLSFKVGFVSMLPNIFPIVVNFGLMGWAGIPLSTATALIAGIAVGLSVDDTIHYLVRYNREFKKDLNRERAMRQTLSVMIRPMMATTLTLAIGFSVLLVSGFQPTSTFGLLIIITMLSALAADLLLLPALMIHLELVTVWDLIRLRLGRPPDEGLMIFHGLSRYQVYYIIMAGVLRRLNPGEIIFRKGDKGDSMYAVVSGELEVVDAEALPERRFEIRRTISRIGVGDIVGEMGMFRAAPRSATVIATAETELLEINERMLRRLNWLYPPTAQRFFINLIRILCNRLEVFTNRCLSLTRTDNTTGLGNIQAFREALEKEKKRAERYALPLALLTIELETPVKDKTGMDLIAAEAALVISKNLRETDPLFRIRPPIFAAILIQCTQKEAEALQGRISDLLRAHDYQYVQQGRRPKVKTHIINLERGKGPPTDEILAWPEPESSKGKLS